MKHLIALILIGLCGGCMEPFRLFTHESVYSYPLRLGMAGEPGNDEFFDDSFAASDLDYPLTKIRIQHGNIVDGIQAFYGDYVLPVHGTVRDDASEIRLEAGDDITEVSGYYGGWFGRNYILQLTFRTRNGRTYGPFGSMDFAYDALPFRLSAKPGERILAFYGSSAFGDNGNAIFLGSIGITVVEAR